MRRLEGKKALVVGAAGKDNMGQTIARRFAAEGAMVAVAGRHQDVLNELAQEISGVAIPCEFTSRESIFSMVDKANREMGGLDIAVNPTKQDMETMIGAAMAAH